MASNNVKNWILGWNIKLFGVFKTKVMIKDELKWWDYIKLKNITDYCAQMKKTLKAQVKQVKKTITHLLVKFIKDYK